MITAKYKCSYCEVEFMLVDDPSQIVCYCPYCGSTDINNIEEPDNDNAEEFSKAQNHPYSGSF